MQIVGTTIGNLFVKSGNFKPLVFKPSAAFLLAGKMSLCFSKFALVSSCISVILKSFSFRSDKQVLQAHIHTNRLISLFKWSYVFFFCKYRNEILSAWCLGNSYLTDFAFYLTMYTTLDTLLELGYEKPASCDRCKLWNGKTILRALGFEVRKLRPLLKEIGIGYFEASDCELQGLRIYFFKPCCCFLLLQCGKRFSLRIVVITFTCEPILLFALIEKVVVHKPSTTEMPCQQIGLRLVRVQSELVCSINLSHTAYKVSNYFVNNQKFMYICGMKENYNHENRHKYYLKCHLIFCIKYRRKILKDEFDVNNKKFDTGLGAMTSRPLEHVQLLATAYESANQSFGSSHYIKPYVSREYFERMSETQVRGLPFIGSLQPWKIAPKKEEVKDEDNW